jgi:hypothetical protein
LAASGLTMTASVAVAVEVSPLLSWVVAVTVRLKLTSLAGVTFSAARFHVATSTVVVPVMAVNVLTPSVSIAPTGMALTTRDFRVLVSPARLLTVLVMAPRVMPEPSTPDEGAAAQPTVGATGVTVMASVVVEDVVLPSASLVVVAMERLKLTSLAGVTFRAARFQVDTSTDVVPAMEVKVCVPSEMMAPTGIALMTTDETVLASPLLDVAEIAPSEMA